MIIFRNISYKNFLSTGSCPIEIRLDKNPTTLIVGNNGAGKSSFTDAISYALFGIPLRAIKKPQLINQINNRELLVDIRFTIGKKNYKIIRGQKPSIFEIYEDDKMFPRMANVRDYQKFLENTILKMNHKSFHQVVVLGSSSFVPFMKLSPVHRRAVIEDLLDIQIFSRMNNILKQDIQKLREELLEITHRQHNNGIQINAQERYISELDDINNTRIMELDNDKEKINDTILLIENDIKETRKEIKTDPDKEKKTLKKLVRDKQLLIREKDNINSQIIIIAKQIKFIDNNDNCPSCRQDISSEHKEAHKKEYKKDGKNLCKKLDDISTSIISMSKEENKKHDLLRLYDDIHKSIENMGLKISWEKDKLLSINGKINTTNNTKGNIISAKDDLNLLVIEEKKIEKKKLEHTREQICNNILAEMLKDSGIKTKIIKQYLPHINKIIKYYLSVLDFFITFELDENFNETIKSRHIDDFSYGSFSEGEKCRINLAVLFAWRQIAKMKNSVSTNLLILDEVFDSSLDSDGVDNLMKILTTIDSKTNTFVISHKSVDVMSRWFPNKILFKKLSHFSKIS